LVAELPAPREVPTDIAAELERLQKQIDELQAARDAATARAEADGNFTMPER
jgi:peptidoglycan hydrolase CwlO-like protein